MNARLEKFKTETQEIKALANGQWPRILGNLIPAIRDACDGFTPNKRPSCGCPYHNSKSNDSFRLLKRAEEVGSAGCFTCGVWNDGFELLMHDRSISFSEAVKLVGSEVGYYDLSGQASEAAKIEADKAQARWEKKREEQAVKDKQTKVRMLKRLSDIWNECFDLEAPESEPARLYFQNRGLGNVGNLNSEVVFHPSLEYYMETLDANGKKNFSLYGRFPAIIAQIRDPNGVPVRIHRTYITLDGHKLQAPDNSPKKMSPEIPQTSISGGAIQLSPAGTKVIGIGEGLETTLAAAAATRMPVNCCINAQLLGDWLPAEGTEYVFVFADKDASKTGEMAANKLAKRLEEYGVTVFILYPPLEIEGDSKGVDWDDAYRVLGKAAFPEQAMNWQELL
ncbi:toprim domain-containing protein [Shewanella sp. JNE4-2]|uniref:Uncharacterized protein n=1 Tax=Shewanella putrefaciens (strain 200) TaxID=399804 RepID=E6XGZ3_SHEP2|nr:toprim domain-containing protein [Shewanella sp. JNE4-2]MCK7657726.1 toprim domain-containing protein [Shewanella sp. JNE4-2]